MGFQLPQTAGHIDVALKCDDALDMTEKEYEAYIENPIPENLVCKPGKTPILMRMRKVLSWKMASKIEDMKLGMVQTRDGDKVEQSVVPKISWMYEEVRCALVDIVNPPDAVHQVKFERDAEGGASHELAAQLLELGVMMDLWNARKNALKVNPVTPSIDKKK